MNTKKGVSPLVATILLIAFAVAIIVLVTIWGRNYIEEKAQKEGALAQLESECQNVEFGFVEACRYSILSKVNVTLKNEKTRQIDGFVFQFKMGGDINPVEVLKRISGGETRVLDVAPSNPSFADATSVNMIPRLKAGKDVYIPCSQKAVEVNIEGIPECV